MKAKRLELELHNFRQRIESWSDDWRLKRVPSVYSKDYLKGILLGLTSEFHTRMDQMLMEVDFEDLNNTFLIKPSRHQIQRYSYKHSGTISAMDVAINKLFGFDVKEGEQFEQIVKPWALVHIDGNTYPIFSDDPGQQDYMRFKDGTTESFGAYNPDTVSTAIYYIVNRIYRDGLKRIEEYKA